MTGDAGYRASLTLAIAGTVDYGKVPTVYRTHPEGGCKHDGMRFLKSLWIDREWSARHVVTCQFIDFSGKGGGCLLSGQDRISCVVSL